jgi:hypothetical protein
MSGTYQRPKRAWRRLTLPHNWDTASREILSRGDVGCDPLPAPDVDESRVRRTLTKLRALRFECDEGGGGAS